MKYKRLGEILVDSKVLSEEDLGKALAIQAKEGKRLGSKSGASEVKAHPFFKSIKFALLRHMTPPIIPNATSNNFTYRPPQYNNKDSGSLDLEAEDESVIISELSIHSQDPFAKFNSGKIIWTVIKILTTTNTYV